MSLCEWSRNFRAGPGLNSVLASSYVEVFLSPRVGETSVYGLCFLSSSIYVYASFAMLYDSCVVVTRFMHSPLLMCLRVLRSERFVAMALMFIVEVFLPLHVRCLMCANF